ncbi:uncharacterized protein METZ01_LOCUS195522 [marine metagenome]|uniref:Uncharacterized protein n=1 Tax=marine metagenome TaxID=408172 RepID=A0A382DWB2_9ZZZZ
MPYPNFFLYIILYGVFLFSCGSKGSDAETTPDKDIKTAVGDENVYPGNSNVALNTQEIIKDLTMDIKKLKADLDYQHENINKIEAQSQIWSNPFAIYNKEIVLSNGSSIFGKIVYQDQDIMKIETLIGQLIIDRNTIVRVVNQVGAYDKFDKESSDTDSYQDMAGLTEQSGANLIQKRIKSMSAHLVLIGDINEEKDGSGNTVLSGEVKNVGTKRADFSKIIFSFRMNWQGDTKTLTAFINGITNTFDTGISSDNSVLPHAVGNFELIIPKSFGTFIGYNYDIDWNQYDE